MRGRGHIQMSVAVEIRQCDLNWTLAEREATGCAEVTVAGAEQHAHIAIEVRDGNRRGIASDRKRPGSTKAAVRDPEQRTYVVGVRIDHACVQMPIAIEVRNGHCGWTAAHGEVLGRAEI